MKTQTILLVLATLSTGVMAGIFFTWSNAVTTGLGRLNDLEYLRAFQAMNRTILNPAFFVMIWSATLLTPIASILFFKSEPNQVFWLLVTAGISYLLGVMAVTFAGNIPLNNLLDQTSLNTISTVDAKSLREQFENKWNFLNWIRTFSSMASFILLVIACNSGNN
ncbi:MAG: anthrone oxygenase family protein [Saonia sp.]